MASFSPRAGVEGLLAVQPDLDRLIRLAIAEAKLLELHYEGKVRIVEPHDYGRHRNSIKLLAYQIAGQSSGPLPNWRWLEIAKISQARILDRTFAGGRLAPTGNHHRWDELFARVRQAGH